LDESLIGAREVSIWKLSSPFTVLWGIIPCVELSAPKLDNIHPEWWEHIEIVVDDLDSFYSEYKQFITETKWFTKIKNRDIEIEFPHTRIWGQLAVKFHEDSIENIIYQE
jgi:predicted metalloenzyme YecM